MVTILGADSASPDYLNSLDEVIQRSESWLSETPTSKSFFEKMLVNSRTVERRYILPVSDILSLGGDKTRGEIYEQVALQIGLQAANSLLKRFPQEKTAIDHLIFISCSSPILPTVDGPLIEHLQLSPFTRRIPIYQYGCAGGVAGLALAYKLCQSGATVLLVSIELCSLVFRRHDLSPANLVGSAIFADGASAALISCNGSSGLRIVESRTHVISETRHLLGYDLCDDGAHLRLHRELPDAIAKHAPELVDNFLSKNLLSRKDIAHWIFHPGGQKILRTLTDEFCDDPIKAKFSADVLTNYGNISSSTVIFSLQRLLESNILNKGDKVMMVAVGPGVCLEQLLLEAL